MLRNNSVYYFGNACCLWKVFISPTRMLPEGAALSNPACNVGLHNAS